MISECPEKRVEGIGGRAGTIAADPAAAAVCLANEVMSATRDGTMCIRSSPTGKCDHGITGDECVCHCQRTAIRDTAASKGEII
jgi:hypothetical protein